MEVGRMVAARSRDGGVGDCDSLSCSDSFPMSIDWPRSWRCGSRGGVGVDGADTGGCGSGLRDCLAML